MRIFLSWSGPRSRKLAEALSEWLPKVIQALKPWMSANDIDPGVRWSPEIARELQTSGYGILCLVPENLDAPWILFEAGALSKVVETARVCPYLLDVAPSDIKGPLAQFQAMQATKDDTLRILKAMNGGLGDLRLVENMLQETFEKWWPDLEKGLAAARAIATSEAPPDRAPEDMLRELLDLARAAERRALEAEQRAQFSPKIQLRGFGAVADPWTGRIVPGIEQGEPLGFKLGLRVTCSKCNKEFVISPPGLLGADVECPHCGEQKHVDPPRWPTAG
jgi:hypothetical protein